MPLAARSMTATQGAYGGSRFGNEAFLTGLFLFFRCVAPWGFTRPPPFFFHCIYFCSRSALYMRLRLVALFLIILLQLSARGTCASVRYNRHLLARGGLPVRWLSARFAFEPSALFIAGCVVAVMREYRLSWPVASLFLMRPARRHATVA